MVFLVVVDVLNLVFFVAMVRAEMPLLRNKTLGRQARFQVAMSDIRATLIYAFMANRFNRFQLWRAQLPMYATKPVPYWPITWPEIVIVAVFVLSLIASIAAPRIIQWRWGEEPPGTVRPFLLSTLLDPAFRVWKGVIERPRKESNQRLVAIAMGCFTSMIFVLGLLSVAATMLFALKNVR